MSDSYEKRLAALGAKLDECARIVAECDELIDKFMERRRANYIASMDFAKDFAREVTPE